MGTPLSAAPVPPPVIERDTGRDLRAAGLLVAALAVVGAVLGQVWAWWAPTTGPAFRRDDGLTWMIEESESAVAADGRYLVLTVAAAVVAAIAVWSRPRLRGPVMLLALAGGSLIGAQVTRLVGWLRDGGATSGPACRIFLPDPVDGHCITHLKLSVQLPGLFFAPAAAAVLAYALCASFAARDDLGHRDPLRAALLQRRRQRREPEVAAVEGSVGQGGEP